MPGTRSRQSFRYLNYALFRIQPAMKYKASHWILTDQWVEAGSNDQPRRLIPPGLVIIIEPAGRSLTRGSVPAVGDSRGLQSAQIECRQLDPLLQTGVLTTCSFAGIVRLLRGDTQIPVRSFGFSFSPDCPFPEAPDRSESSATHSRSGSGTQAYPSRESSLP